MRLKRFLQPLDSPFSTPKAARKLLRLLAWTLMVFLLCALSLFLNATLNNEISQLRRHMNGAMYEAQLYLYQRESLLENLNRGVMYGARVPSKSLRHLYEPLPSHAYVSVPLGDPGRHWSLFLSGRDLQELADKQLGLLYVEPGATAVTRLDGGLSFDPLVPETVLEALRQPGTEDEEQAVRWLADPADGHLRLYLFARVSDHQDAGWLGLELRGTDLMASFNVPEAGSYLLLDQQHRAILGSAPVPAMGEHFRQIWTQDSFALSGGDPLHLHLALLKHLGSSNWSLIYYVSLFDLLVPLWPQLGLSLLLCLIAAVTLWGVSRRIDRRLIDPAQQRLEALVESERFSRTVIQTAPVALCVLRRRDAEAVLKNHLAQCWLEEREVPRRWAHALVEKAFANEQAGNSEEIETADGRHLYLSYAPTRYQGEDVLLCAFSDISECKQTEAALAEAKRMADAANEAKTLFLATMSHEIRTPLYGVLGTLELLERTSLDTQQAGYLQAIQRSSSALLQLISDVLDVSKIEAGQLGLDMVEFSPLELLQDVLQSYAAAARGKGLQIYACCDPQLPLVLLGDAMRIRQILYNLLSNAVKFTDSGRIVVRVRVVGRDGERVTLDWQVADTGIGISIEEQRHLFDPFYQVGGHPLSTDGTGLGLSICRRLSDLMNGCLRVVSDSGLGSSFTLTLPLQQVDTASVIEPELEGALVWVHAPVRELSENLCGWLTRWGARAQVVLPGSQLEIDAEAVLVDVRLDEQDAEPLPDWSGCRVVVSANGHDQPRRHDCDWHVGLYSLASLCQAVGLAQGCTSADKSGGGILPPPQALGMRVLIVEDNPINQLILCDQLKELGCSVKLASDGLEALAIWRSNAFDVVLTDLNMPRMNGYELASALRREGCRGPIIGATANAMPEERERCREAGMSVCLIKPVDLHALHSCLTTIQMENQACSPTES
nr:ATP-binding protein [Pseudomonas carbonaria]